MPYNYCQTALRTLVLLLHLVGAVQITGARGGHDASTGARPFRLEMGDFAASGPGFDLYIQALNQMQATDQSDPFSYFQIAGMVSSVT